MGAHLKDGKFQSDKYPTTPAGKVPLSVEDSSAQDLLWEYAQRRRAVDAEFAADLETALKAAGYAHEQHAISTRAECAPEEGTWRVDCTCGWWCADFASEETARAVGNAHRAAGMHKRSRYSHFAIILREQMDPSIVGFHDLESARRFADEAGAQWSETYLLAVLKGPLV